MSIGQRRLRTAELLRGAHCFRFGSTDERARKSMPQPAPPPTCSLALQTTSSGFNQSNWKSRDASLEESLRSGTGKSPRGETPPPRRAELDFSIVRCSVWAPQCRRVQRGARGTCTVAAGAWPVHERASIAPAKVELADLQFPLKSKGFREASWPVARAEPSEQCSGVQVSRKLPIFPAIC